MRGPKAAALALSGCLGVASLFTIPVALAAPPESAAARPTQSAGWERPTTSGGTPGNTATVTRTRQVTPSSTPSKPPSPMTPCEVPNGYPASQMTSAPWAQQALNFTDAWALSRGDGVRVAVVDSGVDTRNPQMPKMDSYDATGTGNRDCIGHGTMVAGIIAAQDRRNEHIPFLGAAPGVHLISVKVANQDQNNDPRVLAKGIRRAADFGAKIINVSSQTPDYPFLKSAVRYAQAAGALIIAAAGNTDPSKKDAEQPIYPASYPGVMSVGATGKDGKVETYSNAKSNVSVVAPGKSIISTWPGGGYSAKDGTSFAAPYVTATAALVKAYYPAMTAEQIKHRIETTADGAVAVGSGNGMVNPLQAVAAVLPEENGPGQATVRATARAVPVPQPPRKDHSVRDLALSVTGGALGLAGAVAAGGLIIPAGRRRGWQPGRRTTPDPANVEATQPDLPPPGAP